MNIIFITPSYYPHTGGVEKHIRELSFELTQDGNSVLIFTVKKSPDEKNYETLDSTEIIRLEKSKYRFLNRFLIICQFFKNIKKFLDADVIHFHDYITFWVWGIYIYPILKLARKKVFITFHGWEGDFPPEKSVIFKRKICKKLTHKNLCVGHYIEKWYKTKADIISYGGVRKASQELKNKNYILFVGRLTNDTGIFEYIKSWETISPNYSELKFIIIGEGKLRETLENYVQEHNIKNIEFKGLIENAEDYTKKANLIFATGYLSILQAFACKKPVISYYNNDLKEDYLRMIPDSNSLMWIAKDFYEIINCFEKALFDKEKIQKAYQFSLENDWKKVKEDYYKLWSMSKLENQLNNNNIQ